MLFVISNNWYYVINIEKNKSDSFVLSTIVKVGIFVTSG